MKKLNFYSDSAVELMYHFVDVYEEHLNYFWNIKAEDKIHGDDLSLAEYIHTYAFQQFKDYTKEFWKIEIID